MLAHVCQNVYICAMKKKELKSIQEELKNIQEAIKKMYEINPKIEDYLTKEPVVKQEDEDKYNWIIEDSPKKSI